MVKKKKQQQQQQRKKNACCTNLVAYLTATNKLPETEMRDKITKKYPQNT